MIEPPLTLIESKTITKVLTEALRPLESEQVRFPLVSGAVVANAMYHTVIDRNPDIQMSESVLFNIQTRKWTIVIPASTSNRSSSFDLAFDKATITSGTREQLQHDLTLAAMFL